MAGLAMDLALIDSYLLSFYANALRSSDYVFTRLVTTASGDSNSDSDIDTNTVEPTERSRRNRNRNTKVAGMPWMKITNFA